MLTDRIFTFLSYIFSGRTYPSSQRILASRYDRLFRELFKFLCAPKAEPMKGEWPRLQTLIHADARAFFGVMSVAFESQAHSKELETLVQVLCAILIDRRKPIDSAGGGNGEWSYDVVQQGYFFVFLATCVARGFISLDEYMVVRHFFLFCLALIFS